MNHLILYGQGQNATNGTWLRRFLIRRGLDVLVDKSLIENYRPSSGSPSYAARIRISPNKQRVLFAAGASNTSPGVFFTWPDSSDPTTLLIPVATFSNAVVAADCSNTYYAIGGATPFLYVFDWATNSLQTVSTTGLGTVASINFSPDGSKMAVVHSTTPFVRVYDTSTWAYVDATTAANASVKNCQWTPDGTLLVVLSSATPFISVYNAYLTTRLQTYTMANASSGDLWARAIPHWSKPKAIVCTAGYSLTTTGSGIAGNHRMWEYAADTNTVTPIIPNTTANAIRATGLAYDPTNNTLHVVSEFNGFYTAQFDGTSYANKTPTDKELAYLMTGNYVCEMAVLARDLSHISGTVRDISNNPVAREVDIYERTSGILVARGMSDAVTGNYDLTLPYDGTFDVQFKAASGELLNDLFFARATPALV